MRGARSKRPFKGLSPYVEDDFGCFCGREVEARTVLQQLLDEKRLVLHGASGMGKTSLIRAALVRGLEAAGLRPLYVSRSTDPGVEILAGLGEPPPNGESPTADQVLEALDRRLLESKGLLVPIILDQAEDLILYPGRKELLRGLLIRTKEGPSRCALLLSLRSDARLWFRREIDSVYFEEPVSELELRPLTKRQAAAMLDRVSRLYVFGLEAGLQEQLLADLSASPNPTVPGDDPLVLLPQLSLVLDLLYERRQRSPALLLLEEYRQIRIDHLLPDQLRQVQNLLDDEAARVAPQVEIRLVDTTTQRPVARSPAEIAQTLGISPEIVLRVVDALVQRRLAHRVQGGQVQLVHEILARSICDQHLDKDVAAQDAVRGLLRAYLPGWNERGEPLPADVLERAGKVVGMMDLPLPELGLYVGSLVLTQPVPTLVLPLSLEPLLRDRAGELADEFRRASHPRLVALALLLECHFPPFQRKPVIEFRVSPELQPSARFLSEALLPVLARHALGIPEPGQSPDRREIQENQTVALQILAEPDLLRLPISHQSHKLHLNLVRALCGGPFRRLLVGKADSLRFWPGPRANLGVLLVAGFLLSIPASWLLWPAGGQGLGDLVALLFAFGAVLFACACIVEENRVLHTLGSSLFNRASRMEGASVRLREGSRLTTGALAVAGMMYSLAHVLTHLSHWLHHYFFTAVTFRAAWSWTTGFTENAPHLPGQIVAGVHDFFFGIPLLSAMLQGIVSLPDGSSGLWWGVLRVGSLLLAAFVAMGCLPLILAAAATLPGLLLLPPGLVAALGCARLDQLLCFPLGMTRARRGGEIVAISLVTGLAFLLALRLSHIVLSWVSPFLWRPDVFYGEHGMASFSYLLGSLGREPAPLAVAFAVSLAAAILVRSLGDRRVRCALVRSRQSLGPNDPDYKVLRPLFAERTEESLRLALRLLAKWPSVRAEESFGVMCLLALADPLIMPAVSEERVQALASEAETALQLFEPRFWQLSWLATLLRSLVETETGSRSIRARRLLLRANWAESASISAAGAEAASLPSFSGITSVLATGLVCGVLLVGVHTALVLSGHLVDAAFPLATRLAPPLSDFKGTLSWGIRILEIPTFGLLVGLPIYVAVFFSKIIKIMRIRTWQRRPRAGSRS